MSGRAKIGFGEALSDLGGFAPNEAVRQTGTSLRETAAAAGFVSREPSPSEKVQRRHRTGRSAQINLKARPETIAAFQSWASGQGLSMAEAFEAMVEKLPETR